MDKALSNIKILDLTRVLAGPYATMILGDMGAEIIKVEKPGIGDDSRSFGPYQNGESAYFMSINRNKRSITIDLKQEKGKQILLEIIKKVDVIVENFRPGTMEKLGLGYNVLSKINPKLVYTSISGFGHSGPYSQRPAYDGVVQAMGGIMSITGSQGGKPTRVGPSIGDLSAGLYGAIGILGAIIHSIKTGKGQKVDISMLDCQVSLLENAIARYVVTGKVPTPSGNRHSSIVPFEPFETVDGEIMIAAGNDSLWNKLCRVIDKGELISDARFISNPLRNKNYQELRILLADSIKKKTTSEWQIILDEAGIPNGPINTVDKVIENPQVIARDMIVEVAHPIAGKLKIPGIPIKMSETPGKITMPSPILGQHTEEILNYYLGYDKKEIEELRKEAVI